MAPSDKEDLNESKTRLSSGEEGKRGDDDVDLNIYEIDKMLSESINDNHGNREEQENIQQKRQVESEAEDTLKRHKRAESENESEDTAIHESSKVNNKVGPIDGKQDENDVSTSSPNRLRNLELEFERAIEGQQEEIGTEHQKQNDERTILEDKSSGNSDEKVEKSPQTVYHGGVAVPANSELLNTNTAFEAYSALSSQFPPLAVLANAHLAALPLPIVAPDYLPPRIQLLINTLPTLDNLATQLLRIVAVGPYQKIVELASNPDSPSGAAYRDLTSLFEFTKKLYSEEDPFLSVEHIAPGMWKGGEKTPSILRNREQSIESTLRKVNLATFLAAALGTIEVGFFHLNESFLDVFCPINNLDPDNALSNMNSNNMSLQSGVNTAIGDRVGKLLKPQAELYLELKTQAYISAIEAGDRSKEEIMEDIIPSNLDEILLARRGSNLLSPTEQDFIERCLSRKETLLSYSDDKNLTEEYEWFSFLKDLFDYISKNMGFVIWGKRGRNVRERTKGNTKDSSVLDNEEIIRSASSIPAPEQSVLRLSPTADLRSQEISEITSSLLPSEIQEQQLHLRINPGSNLRNLQRRPWTRDEEKALRHALELKGPMWSTILELFGNGGKISEALKNRTQVQLKDKARNWKMFFLKSGLPVPNYLQKVTGDLERDDRLKANKRANRSKKAALSASSSPSAAQVEGSGENPMKK
ncbi:uncharacterized protein PRCAT00004163001 [Priceomyces carsonii]|uniref:uncharacterized protein n=1 Tax=Priceomyces carsonii TaxID=28549 RepID=UPI002ED8286C|nr:unnamed protein product [Priceomyces carsonii]